jgi:hypothetical protein
MIRVLLLGSAISNYRGFRLRGVDVLSRFLRVLVRRMHMNGVAFSALLRLFRHRACYYARSSTLHRRHTGFYLL